MEDEIFPLLFGGSFSCCFGIIWLISMGIGVISFILWIIMLIDVIKRDEEGFPEGSKNQKLIWLLIVVLTGWIGALMYYFLVYKKMGRSDS